MVRIYIFTALLHGPFNAENMEIFLTAKNIGSEERLISQNAKTGAWESLCSVRREPFPSVIISFGNYQSLRSWRG
jgi:hypothetical protein